MLYDRHIPQSEGEKRNRFFPSEIEAGMTEESLVARYNTVEARWLASPLCKRLQKYDREEAQAFAVQHH